MNAHPDSTADAVPMRLSVAVVLARLATQGPAARWQPWRWTLADVVPDEPAFGAAPRLLRADAHEQRWLYPGFAVELFRDDAAGYRLNLDSPAPCWFVMWRVDEEAAEGSSAAMPVAVSLSYHDAGRWLDAQETVEQVPAPPEVLDWLRAFTDEHFSPEPKRRARPQSFRPLADRFGQPARVSTGRRDRAAGET